MCINLTTVRCQLQVYDTMSLLQYKRGASSAKFLQDQDCKAPQKLKRNKDRFSKQLQGSQPYSIVDRNCTIYSQQPKMMMRTSVVFLVLSALVACSLAAPTLDRRARQVLPSAETLLNTLSTGLDILSKHSVSPQSF